MTKAVSNASAPAAKGDLVVGSGTNLSSVLAAGSTNQVLTVDSSTGTGLKWATASGGSESVAGKNAILNSNFSVWQRGTSLSATGSTSNYTADRWLGYNSSTAFTISRQATGDTTNLPNIQYCARIQRNSGATATTYMYLSQSFETVNSIPFAGKTVTYSFYARKGADFSDGTSVLRIGVNSGTGTDQNWLVSYTGDAAVIAGTTLTLTTTWQRFTYTGTVATTAKELTVWFEHRASGTAGANDYYEITGLQLEVAASASAYSPNQATYASELAACQRYYYRLSGPGSIAFFGSATNPLSTQGNAWVQHPVTMRTTPTSVDSASLCIREASGTRRSMSSIVLETNGTNPNLAFIYGTISGGTLNIAGQLTADNTTAGYIGFSAEL